MHTRVLYIPYTSRWSKPTISHMNTSNTRLPCRSYSKISHRILQGLGWIPAKNQSCIACNFRSSKTRPTLASSPNISPAYHRTEYSRRRKLCKFFDVWREGAVGLLGGFRRQAASTRLQPWPTRIDLLEWRGRPPLRSMVT